MSENPEIDRPLGILVRAGILACVGLGIAINAPSALHDFREFFAVYGAQLTLATRVVLASAFAWWLLALAGIALAFWIGRRNRVTPDELRKMKLLLSIYSAVLGVAVGFAVIAIYIPIFQLGQP
jgi:type II secretory pathway component PulF